MLAMLYGSEKLRLGENEMVILKRKNNDESIVWCVIDGEK